MFLDTQADVKQARYSLENAADRKGLCEPGEHPDYNEFLRWQKCFDVKREQQGSVFAEVPWPPTYTQAKALYRSVRYDSKLSEFKLSEAASLSCEEWCRVTSKGFYKPGGLCAECEDRLEAAGHWGVLRYLHSLQINVEVPNLTGDEVWRCTDGTCTTCAIFNSAQRPNRCNLCDWSPRPEDEYTWCGWLVATRQDRYFLNQINQCNDEREQQKVQKATEALNKLTTAVQAKSKARAAQLRALVIEASRRQLGGGDVTRFATRCQGELIALGKRARREKKSLSNLPTVVHDYDGRRAETSVAAQRRRSESAGREISTVDLSSVVSTNFPLRKRPRNS